MNAEWARQEIDFFLDVTKQVAPNTGQGVVYFGTVMRGPKEEADERAHVVEQIVSRVLGAGWADDRPSKDSGYKWLRVKASAARAAITRQGEIAENLGENLPAVRPEGLHPWAWDSGASFWRNGHFHQAVMQAAIRINAEAQAKIGRMDVSETALFNEAFSANPPTERAPRLRLAVNDGSETYSNLHRGARAFAEGLYAAIRNPGVHRPAGDENAQVALEQLAAFSVLARWVDEAFLETV